MLNIGKIKIHCSFFFFMILVIGLGQIKQFFIVVAATTMHELSHVAAASFFGLKTTSVIITPIGETAYLDGFDGIPAFKKNIILIAGPMANIIPAALIFSLKLSNKAPGIESFMGISFAIGIFNLLPVYPLDGGKLAFVFWGNRLGILRGIKLVRLLTKAGIAALFASGFIQTVLFPLNFSLLAIAAFLLSIYEREKSAMIFSYYTCMLNKSGRLKSRVNTKTAAIDGECRAADAEKLFTWDYFHIIYVTRNGEIAGVITEKQIFDSSVNSNAQIKLFDITRKNVI